MKKRNFACAVIIVFLFVAAQLWGKTLLLDVPRLAGKTKSEVEKALGKTGDCGESKYGEECSWDGGKTEIVFIDGKADWITVSARGVGYNKGALKRIGLSVVDPSFATVHVLRWENIPGFIEISLFPLHTGKGADYFYIQVRTK